MWHFQCYWYYYFKFPFFYQLFSSVLLVKRIENCPIEMNVKSYEPIWGGYAIAGILHGVEIFCAFELNKKVKEKVIDIQR